MKNLLLLSILIQSISFPQSGWIEQISGTTQNLTSVIFTDLNNGFIVGSTALLKRQMTKHLGLTISWDYSKFKIYHF